MKQLSNSDYDSVLRLLRHLARTKGDSIRDSEAARKAGLMVKKLERNKSNGL